MDMFATTNNEKTAIFNSLNKSFLINAIFSYLIFLDAVGTIFFGGKQKWSPN